MYSVELFYIIEVSNSHLTDPSSLTERGLVGLDSAGFGDWPSSSGGAGDPAETGDRDPDSSSPSNLSPSSGVPSSPPSPRKKK